MNALVKVFEFADKSVRIVLKNGEPWFAAKDVCSILDIKNASDAVSSGLDAEEKGIEIFDTLGGRQETTIVSESGLYTLIFRSTKPNAKLFRRWVTGTVLPAIRQTGQYIAKQETDDEIMHRALVISAKRIELMATRLEELEPKGEFFDAVAGSKDAIDIGTVAKLLAFPDIGRTKLFEILRERSILMAGNRPYQTFIDRGYFRVIEQKWQKPDGSEHIYIKTLVFQKGVDYIRKTVADMLVAQSTELSTIP